MPLHTTGLTSRRQLDHPNEKPPEKIEPLNYERVLKYNPNHGPDGKFSSGGGGRKGGTAGTPTEDAMGRPLKGKAAARLTGVTTTQDFKTGTHFHGAAGHYSVTTYRGQGGKHTIVKHLDNGGTLEISHHTSMSSALSRAKTYAAVGHSPNKNTYTAPSRTPHDPHLEDKTKYTAPSDHPRYSPEDPMGTVYSSSGEKYLPHEALPLGDMQHDPVGTLYFSDRKYLPHTHTGSMDKSGKPTKRSTFS